MQLLNIPPPIFLCERPQYQNPPTSARSTCHLLFTYTVHFVDSCRCDVQIASPCASLYLTTNLLILRKCVSLSKGAAMIEFHFKDKKKGTGVQIERRLRGLSHCSTSPSPGASSLWSHPTWPHIENSTHLARSKAKMGTSILPVSAGKKRNASKTVFHWVTISRVKNFKHTTTGIFRKNTIHLFCM